MLTDVELIDVQHQLDMIECAVVNEAPSYALGEIEHMRNMLNNIKELSPKEGIK